jgi:glycosyltransferase involved in cell wall biosynthesis
VVIPVRNRSELVDRAIKSVLQQSKLPSEIIIVDDGSTDDTLVRLRIWQAKDPTIKVLVHEKSMGAPAARNTGWQSATGEFIAFLDSDDEWIKTKLELQIASISASPKSVACFCWMEFVRPNQPRHVVKCPEVVYYKDLEEYNVLGSTSTALIRKSALKKVSGFDVGLPSCQDWGLWLQLSKLGPLLVVQMPLLLYHTDSQNSISKNIVSVENGHRTMFKYILDSQPDSKRRRELEHYHRLCMARLYSWNYGQRKYPMMIFLKLIFIGGWRIKLLAAKSFLRTLIFGSNSIQFWRSA